ncbi:MAG: hypothetical protein LBD63_02285, partial [Mycoplasmataceae bacterium]|nr:hypothetical protein [Mycoplasmataceae bacterium]
YTVNATDYKAHYPQGYVPNKDPVYNPYTQDFLALVPQNPNSYQTYNIKINSSVHNFTIGQHVYFLSQPRFFGLEYASGLKHIVIRPVVATTHDQDSFRNWQFTPPSYTLSGMSYDRIKSQWIKKWEQMNIKQCRVDISPNQTFSNYLAPGDKQKWAQAFMFSRNWTDVDFNNDLPAFIANKKAEYRNNDACLNGSDNVPWKNINVYLPDQTKIIENIPYYQVIQQSSNNWNDVKSIIDGSNLAVWHYYVNEWKTDYSNIGYDQTTDKFTWFGMGLNYLFYADNMQASSDNVFYYNKDQLNNMNLSFVNQPV